MVAAQSTPRRIVCWWSQDLVNNVNNSIGGRDVSERDDSTIGTDCDSSVGDSDGQLITIRCNRVCARQPNPWRESFQQQRGKAECPLGLQSLHVSNVSRRFCRCECIIAWCENGVFGVPLSVVTRVRCAESSDEWCGWLLPGSSWRC